MEKKPLKTPVGNPMPRGQMNVQDPMATRMMAGKPLVSRRKPAMPEAPVAAPMGGRKPRKPVGNPMNPMMGKNKPKRGMY